MFPDIFGGDKIINEMENNKSVILFRYQHMNRMEKASIHKLSIRKRKGRECSLLRAFIRINSFYFLSWAWRSMHTNPAFRKSNIICIKIFLVFVSIHILSTITWGIRLRSSEVHTPFKGKWKWIGTKIKKILIQITFFFSENRYNSKQCLLPSVITY